MKRLIALLSLVLMATPAFADCYYNGQSYPEGTQVGPYTCSAGQWVSTN